MAVAQLQKLFGRQRHSLCLAASIPGFLFTGTSPWIIKGISEIWPFLSAFLLHKFVPQNCKVCDTDVKVEFSPSSHVCVSLSVSLTGSHPDGNKPRGEAAPTENYESTIPLLLQGKDPRPLSQLRTRVRALITSSVTFHLCFPRTVKQDGRQKRVFRLQMAMEESYFYNINFRFLKWNVRKFFFLFSYISCPDNWADRARLPQLWSQFGTFSSHLNAEIYVLLSAKPCVLFF